MRNEQFPSLCNSCVYLGPNRTCDAFPELIPEAIVVGCADHRVPWPGDHGIQWRQRPGSDAELADWIEFGYPAVDDGGTES